MDDENLDEICDEVNELAGGLVKARQNNDRARAKQILKQNDLLPNLKVGVSHTMLWCSACFLM